MHQKETQKSDPGGVVLLFGPKGLRPRFSLKSPRQMVAAEKTHRLEERPVVKARPSYANIEDSNSVRVSSNNC